MTNPSCPQCPSKTHKNGTTSAGVQRYRCASCGHSFTGTLHGTLPLNSAPMTAAERQRMYVANNKEKEQARWKMRKRGKKTKSDESENNA